MDNSDNSNLDAKQDPELDTFGCTLAEPSTRLVAKLIDWAIVGGFSMIILLPWMYTTMSNSLDEKILTGEIPVTFVELLEYVSIEMGSILLWSTAVIFLLSGLYTIPQIAIWGHTIGKKITGIAVIGPQGSYPPGWKASGLRWILPSAVPQIPVAGILLGPVGYLWIFVDKRRRAWHDIIASTLVVNTHTIPTKTK